jgi:hypothetical protein
VRIRIAVCLVLAGCSALWPVNRADPRFAACGGNEDNAEAAFAFVAREYRQHFPLMGHAPELETDGPAFAVVFAANYQPVIIGGPLGANPGPPTTSRFVCVYVGVVPTGNSNLYGVDIMGMQP